jgi:hypothetical protein
MVHTGEYSEPVSYTARSACNLRVGHSEVSQISEYKRVSRDLARRIQIDSHSTQIKVSLPALERACVAVTPCPRGILADVVSSRL